ncbi:hypothetical protein SAMN05661080_01979 [Modestobacter sp. DSM 44400]|nr:hypothetical protein SAMN05661080_01979 [Modestobacter sp. DSM 44400]
MGIELNASYHLSVTSGHVTAVFTPAGAELPLATYLIEVSSDDGRLAYSGRLTCLVEPPAASS